MLKEINIISFIECKDDKYFMDKPVILAKDEVLCTTIYNSILKNKEVTSRLLVPVEEINIPKFKNIKFLEYLSKEDEDYYGVGIISADNIDTNKDYFYIVSVIKISNNYADTNVPSIFYSKYDAIESLSKYHKELAGHEEYLDSEIDINLILDNLCVNIYKIDSNIIK